MKTFAAGSSQSSPLSARGPRQLEQERAKFAWDKCENVSTEFANLAKGSSAFIMTNGLMAAVAFYLTKASNSKPHRDLANLIAEWLARSRVLPGFGSEAGSANAQGLLKRLAECRPTDYQRATMEALRLLRWVKLFATVRAGERT